MAYARVRNVGQKDEESKEIDFLRRYANGKGISFDEVITDIGSAWYYKRKKWNAL